MPRRAGGRRGPTPRGAAPPSPFRHVPAGRVPVTVTELGPEGGAGSGRPGEEGVSQRPARRLADGAPRELGDEVDRLRELVAGQRAGAELPQLRLARRGA